MTKPFFFVLFAYLLGSLPVGVLLARLKGQDPRKMGSGNIGATNVMRTAGKKLGIVTLLGDMLKGLIPVLLTIWSGQTALLIALVGLAAFIGHLFPVYLKFKGGKGVSTALGVFLALSPLGILIAVAVFLFMVWKWRYVSLGSLTGSGLMPVSLLLLKAPLEYVAVAVVVVVLIFIKHRENIRRLVEGRENRFGTSRG